jgi:hypothetical protein
MKNWSFLLVAAFISVPLCAKVIRSKSEKDFFNRLERERLAVVLFSLDDAEDRQWQVNMNNARREFDAASKTGLYGQAGVEFIEANASKKKLVDVDDSYDVVDMPTVMLFRRGVPYRNKDGSYVSRAGFMTDDNIRTFINEHMKSDIQDEIKRRSEERAYRDYVNANWYFSVGYPGYYYYYGPWWQPWNRYYWW